MVDTVNLPLTGAGDATAVVATDDAGAAGQVQIVKLAVSADGSAAPITADAGGLLVNLGTNNDVTVTGTVTAAGDVGTLDQLDLTTTNPLAVAIVDGNGDQITSFGGGTQYTEDAAAAADPVGTMGMAVRADSLAAVTTTDGDNIALRATNKGELYVKQTDAITVSSHAVTNAGTFVVQENGAALTSLQLIDDAIFVDDTATHATGTTKGVGIMAAATPTDTAVNANDIGMVGMTNNREMYVSLRDNNGTATASGSGTAAAAMRVELANNGTGVLATVGAVTSITNAVTVNSHAVTNAGTFAVQVDGAALTSLQLIDDVIFTDDTSTHATGTTKGAGIMAVANPTDAAVDANDIGMVAMTLARALKNDITTIAGTAPTTAGFIDIKGADGNVFVRQATAANLNMTEASAASALTSLQLIDDGVYIDDTSTHATGTSKGYGIMAAATPTDTAVNANDIGMIGMTNNRELYVSLRDIVGAAAQSGSGTATGALRVELANNGTGLVGLNAGTNGIGKLTANSGVTIGAVEIAAAQTLATVSTVTAVTTITNDVKVVGNTADDSPASGSPVPMGATARQTNRTAVTDGDVVRVAADDIGRQVTVIGQVRDLMTHAATTITNSNAETTILAAGAAGVFHDLTQLVITNGSASAYTVTIKDATAGTTRGIFAIAANGGAVIPFNRPWTQASAANNWTATLSSNTVTCYFVVQAEKNV